MTPTTDDNGRWLDALYVAIAVLWTGLGIAWGYVWKEVAMKRWVESQLSEQREKDLQADRQLFTDLIAPVMAEIGTMKGEQAARHKQNSDKLDKLLRFAERRGAR